MKSTRNIPNKAVRARLMKQQSQIARNLLKKTYSVFVLGCTENAQLYTLDGVRYLAGQQEALALNNHSCEWAVSSVMAIREANGKLKLEIKDLDFNSVTKKGEKVITNTLQCRFNQINELVADVIKSEHDNHPEMSRIKSVGWIASYKTNLIPPELAHDIFVRLDAWSNDIEARLFNTMEA